jgi:hypothetical protein
MAHRHLQGQPAATTGSCGPSITISQGLTGKRPATAAGQHQQPAASQAAFGASAQRSEPAMTTATSQRGPAEDPPAAGARPATPWGSVGAGRTANPGQAQQGPGRRMPADR